MFIRTESSTREDRKAAWITAALIMVLESKSERRVNMVDWGSSNCDSRNVNIPWPSQGMGDADYMFAFQQIIMPIAHEFDPDLVIGKLYNPSPKRFCLATPSLTISIVSAGFDAAAGDELGGCFVSPACYGHMTHMLMNLAHGKVAVCLEVCQLFAFSVMQESDDAKSQTDRWDIHTHTRLYYIYVRLRY